MIVSPLWYWGRWEVCVWDQCNEKKNWLRRKPNIEYWILKIEYWNTILVKPNTVQVYWAPGQKKAKKQVKKLAILVWVLVLVYRAGQKKKENRRN